MSLPVISQPDISSAQLNDNISAAQSVTNYAQAIVTAVPMPDDLPDWYAPINADIINVQSHAGQWLNEICPAVSTNIPQSIVNFNITFQASSTGILNLLQQITGQTGGLPTADQQQLVNNYLTAVQGAASDQNKVANEIYKTVSAFSETANADQQEIAGDLNTIAGKISSGAAAIDQMQSAIGESFLDSTMLGPCNVIVSIDMNITIKVTGLNTDPSIISSVYLQAILQNVLGNIQTAQKCVQNVVDTWAIIMNKFSAVISDLADASSDQYVPNLQELDFTMAQMQWQQLADFASTLIQGS